MVGGLPGRAWSFTRNALWSNWECSFVPGAAASPNNPAYRLGARLLLWPVAKLVADSAAKEGFPQTARESASSLKPSRNDCLGLRRTVKENGGGPLQTSALPLGYGARGKRKLAARLTSPPAPRLTGNLPGPSRHPQSRRVAYARSPRARHPRRGDRARDRPRGLHQHRGAHWSPEPAGGP